MKKRIKQILFDLGIPASLRGFDYLADGIEYAIETKRPKMGMLYLYVANKHNTRDVKVERSIRHAITRIDRESEAFKKYVGNVHRNSEIIYNIAYKITEEIEDEQYISARDSWRFKV